jgi:hypothetical protein
MTISVGELTITIPRVERAAIRAGAVLALAAGLLQAPASTAGPAKLMLHFTVLTKTPLKLTDIVWTGTRFFYVDNTTNRVFEADPSGTIRGLFSTMPKIVEETRCVPSPARYGFPKGGLFCHSPDNRIYRITPGGIASQFAVLPESATSDGALAVDDVGRFGHRLVAATGRSGGAGGNVYTIDNAGKVAKVGAYPGPGGAENLVVAPSTFGAEAGSALLSIDGTKVGRVAAVDPSGVTTTIANLPDGANPIAVIPRRLRTTGVPSAGFYVVDTFPGTVLIANARQFNGYSGSVLVGTELKGQIWLITPTKSGFISRRYHTNLTAPKYNLEGATFVP